MSISSEIRLNLLNSFKNRNLREYEPFNSLIKSRKFDLNDFFF